MALAACSMPLILIGRTPPRPDGSGDEPLAMVVGVPPAVLIALAL